MQIQRSLSVFMMDNSNFQKNSPQQKLRKISFDASPIEQPFYFRNKQKQIMQGWGAQNWDFQKQSINVNRNPQKHNNRGQHLKNNSVRKRFLIQLPETNGRKQYIQKLQQKLWQLVNGKECLQKKKQCSEDEYLGAKSYQRRMQKTSSTSESDHQKLENNFTSTQRQLGYNFKARRQTRQFLPYSSLLKRKEYEGEHHQKSSGKMDRSLLNNFLSLNQKPKQVSIISYPVIEERRKSRTKKLLKLQDFIHNYQNKSSTPTAQTNIPIKTQNKISPTKMRGNQSKKKQLRLLFK